MKTTLVELVAAFSGIGLIISEGLPGEERIFAYSAFAGILAALGSIRIWEPKTHKEAVDRVVGNAILAILSGPVLVNLVCQYFPALKPTFSTTLVVSGGVGLGGTTIVKQFAPPLLEWAAAKLRSLLGIPKAADVSQPS